jgi:hypothetical protein
VTGTVVTTGDTGSVTSTMLLDGTILNADVNASAAIAGTKISPDFGSQTVTTTGVISSALGAAATPSITFTGDLNTGIFSPGADEVAISTNGTGRLFVNADGKIGIGNTVASSMVGDGITIGTGVSGQASVCTVYSNSDTYGALYFADATSGAGRYAGGVEYVHSSDALRFYANSDERMRLDSSGRLGIGVTGPLTPLHVATSSDTPGLLDCTGGTQSYLYLRNTGGGAYVSSQSNDLAFHTSGSATERARIDSSGRLLVGTSSTSVNFTTALLQGNAISSTGEAALRLARGSSSPASGDGLGNIVFADSGHGDAAYIFCARDGGTWTSGSSQPTRLVFSTTADGASSPTERMRITNTGNAYFLLPDQNRGVILSDTGALSTTDVYFSCRHSATTPGSGTECMVIRRDGDLENTNNSYGAYSDAKLKENVVAAGPQWDDVKSLQIRKYNFKAETGYGTHTQIGVIAQEVELVSPGLVSESTDLDADGNDLGTVTKSVNYSVLYMKAVKALQEAMERIEVLEQRLTDAGIA